MAFYDSNASGANSQSDLADCCVENLPSGGETVERCDTCAMCVCLCVSNFGSTTEPSESATPTSVSSTVTDCESRPHKITSLFTEGATLMQIKTETRQQWSSNRRKGTQITTKYFYQEIDSSWTVAVVLVCFFTAGLVDAIVYQCWGTFVSMQTGNTILIALRLSDLRVDPHPLAYLKNLTSLGSYAVGSLFFNILHRYPGGLSNPNAPLHRWTLFLAFGVQSTILMVIAILATAGVISGGSGAAGASATGLNNSLDLVAIAFLAFEAAGQVCLSRVLKISDLPTIVISTLIHDFIADTLNTRRCWRASTNIWEFAVTQKQQARRLAGVVSMFMGALIGDFIYSATKNIMGTLWLAAGSKLCICLGWCLWKKKVVTETVVTTEQAEKEKKNRT